MQADVKEPGAALWTRVRNLVSDRTGLHFPDERRSDLQRGLALAAQEAGYASLARYSEWLLSSTLSPAQLNTLAGHLTIGETYFFRERRTLEALAQHVLPPLIRERRESTKRLRVWSAACSTGEEPYSLAILLQQLIPDWREWHITILASDINERSLHKAEAGVYGEWSFRDSEPDFKAHWFRKLPDGRYAIAPHVRGCVQFAQLNLAQEVFPSLATNTNAMDLILCRNLLIYFSSEHARRLVERLRLSLVQGGWLAVSPSECSQTLFARFATANYPGAILYRNAPTASQVPACQPEPTLLEAEAQFAQGEFVHAVATALEADPEPGSYALLARSYANQGKLLEALQWTTRWLVADKLEPSAHYLHAMILQEMNERENARRALQRAIFLQPEFVLAHFALGNLARVEQRREDAAKHFANALALLGKHPSDELLEDSEGLTAGRLAQMISAVAA